MHKTPLFTALLCSPLLLAQTALAKVGNVFEPFVPAGFVLQGQQCDWDFNQDKKADCVLLIKDSKADAWQTNTHGERVDRNRRGLIILLQADTGYQKVLENRAIFASENEEGGVYFAPELDITGKGKKLIVNYGHGRYGFWSYSFDYRKVNGGPDFYLIGYDSSSHHGPYVQSTISINFLTHKIRYQKNMNSNWEDDAPKFKTTWRDFAKQPLIKLSDIKDIDNIDLQNADKALIGID